MPSRFLGFRRGNHTQGARQILGVPILGMMGPLGLLEVRQASALVDAYLVSLRHVVHHPAALRLPLAEEVDVHFRSPLQLHFARVQYPSLIRVGHSISGTRIAS